MIFNFKFLPYFNILQNFVENVQKTKKPSVLSCILRFDNRVIFLRINLRNWTRLNISSICVEKSISSVFKMLSSNYIQITVVDPKTFDGERGHTTRNIRLLFTGQKGDHGPLASPWVHYWITYLFWHTLRPLSGNWSRLKISSICVVLWRA